MQRIPTHCMSNVFRPNLCIQRGLFNRSLYTSRNFLELHLSSHSKHPYSVTGNRSTLSKHCSKKQIQSWASKMLLGELVPLLHPTALGRNIQVRCMSTGSNDDDTPKKRPRKRKDVDDRFQGNDEDEKKGKEEEERDDEYQVSVATLFKMFLYTTLLVTSLSLFARHKLLHGEVTWQEFYQDMLAKGEVREVVINTKVSEMRDKAMVKLYPGAVFRDQRVPPNYIFHVNGIEKIEEKIRKAEEELGIKPSDAVSIVYKHKMPNDELVFLLFYLLAVGAIVMFFRNISRNVSMQMTDVFGQLGRARYTRGDRISKESRIEFKDVAGLQEPKQEIMEFVEYLKNPERFKKLGAKVPKGALLLGPPGCGKTLLAKAVASEAGVPFLTMAGSGFVEMVGGLGASRVRDLFKDARAKAPCIVYIDEIDAIGKQRAGTDSEEEHTLMQLLVELDGMQSMEGVILLASTNRHEVLDKALLRPGRFDRHITIDLPTLAERKEIYSMYLKKIKTSGDPLTYVDRLAELSPGMSGADIKNICNEAALYAARHEKQSIDHQDFDYAMEKVIAGVAKKTSKLTENEKRIVAYHEAGHAVAGWLLEHTDALLKVSIVARTNATLGFAQYSPTDNFLVSKEELFDRMCMALGGRAAEALFFNKITSGAQDDIHRVTQLAYAQIRNLGMSERIGNLSFQVDENNEFGIKPFSKRLKNVMDEEAGLLVSRAYQVTEALLLKNKDKVKMVAEALLEKQVLNYNDVQDLIGPPPFGGKKTIDSNWRPAVESPSVETEEKPAPPTT